MTPRTVNIVRHGHREDFLGDEMGSTWSKTAEYPFDPDLSPRGELEAKALAERLRAEAPFTIYASPFLRTVHTASHVAKAVNAHVKLEFGLHEWMQPGSFPAFPTLRTMSQLQDRFGTLDVDHKSSTDKAFPEDDFYDVVHRVGAAFETILEHSEGDLLIVTHADPLVALLASTGVQRCKQPVRTCAVYQLKGVPGNWNLTLDGDTAHL